VCVPLTHAHGTVGFADQLHGEGKVLQVVAEEAERFELRKRDALQHTQNARCAALTAIEGVKQTLFQDSFLATLYTALDK